MFERWSNEQRDKARATQDQILAIVANIPNIERTTKVAEYLPMTIGDLDRWIYPEYQNDLESVLRELQSR